jgi:hypothetical protein
MRGICCCALLILLLLASPTSAIERKKDGAYLCTPEMAAGFMFDEQQHHWRSAIFKPGSSFILRLKYLGERSDTSFGTRNVWDAFDATIVPTGSDDGPPCFSVNTSSTTTPSPLEARIDQYDWLRCSILVEEFVFNARSNRFERHFAGGFLVGDPNNKDTPLMQGGTCTKIQ